MNMKLKKHHIKLLSYLILAFSFFGSSLHCKKKVLSTKIKDIQLCFLKHSDINISIQELQSEDALLYFTGVKAFFNLLDAPTTVLMQKSTLSLQPTRASIFQIIGFDVKTYYQDFSVTSKKVDAYIDLENFDNIDIAFEKNYKLQYKNFQLASNHHLSYRKNTLKGENLFGGNDNLNLKFYCKSLEGNLIQRELSFYNSVVHYTPIGLTAKIETILYIQGLVSINNTSIKIKDMDIKIKKASLATLSSVIMTEIECNNLKFKMHSHDGYIDINEKRIVCSNVTIKIKKATLKIKQCIFNLNNPNIDMINVQIFVEDKHISTSSSGSFNIDTSCFSLENGAIQG